MAEGVGVKILYLAHRIPYPPNKGDKIRSFYEIKYLSKSHQIHLGCLADEPGDQVYEHELKKFCDEVCVVPISKFVARLKALYSIFSSKPLSTKYFYSKLLQSKVDQWLSSNFYDAIICFSSSMAEYLFRSSLALNLMLYASRAGGCRPVLVIDFCDVDSDKWAQYAKEAVFPLNLIYKIESMRLFEYEKRTNLTFDYSIFVSQQEADLFKRLFPGAVNISVIPNGVDYEYFSPKFVCLTTHVLRLKFPSLVFTGAMDYHANVDAVDWFCSEILPLIRQQFPTIHFYIVGSNPSPKVRKLGQLKGVTVTGFVENIRPYYQSSDVAVVPLRLARGIQNKILEAMSMARPVVTTSKALEGIQAVPGKHVLIADNPEAFANQIVRLLRNEIRRKDMGSKAREFVVKNYDWKTNIQKFDKIFGEP